MIKNSPVQAIARLLMALLFIVAGARKVFAFGGTAAYFSHLGLPAAGVVTALVILIELVGGVALVFGWQQRWLAIGLAIYTFATALVGHQFWVADAAHFSGQLNNFLKNIAIVGGFILLAQQAKERAWSGHGAGTRVA